MNIKSNLIFPTLQILNKPLSGLNNFFGQNKNILYVAEPGWSLRHDAESIKSALDVSLRRRFKIFRYPLSIHSDLYHFASNFQWVKWQKSLPKNKTYICNYYHGKKTDSKEMSDFVEQFLETTSKLSKIVVSNSIVKKRLIDEYKIEKNKICHIPLGVNNEVFKPRSQEIINQAKIQLSIPKKQLVIGSFQKDGEGKKNGYVPKFIKGPDILVNVLKILSKNFSITVLLSAPARGYVIKELEFYGIKYIYSYLNNPDDLYNLYNAIDLYLITSREEGGPKGLIEALSSGKKVVTTPVGMSNDLKALKIKNLLVSETFNPEELAALCSKQFEQKNYESLSLDSHYKIKNYCAWPKVASDHFKKLYF